MGRTEYSPEVDPYKYSKPIFDKGTKIQWKMDIICNKWCSNNDICRANNNKNADIDCKLFTKNQGVIQQTPKI